MYAIKSNLQPSSRTGIIELPVVELTVAIPQTVVVT
jgi:hypothetical protein